MPDYKIPTDLDAEKAVLGSLILPDDEDNTAWASVQRVGLKPEDFWDINHQHIYRAMVALQSEGMALDQITIAHQLAQMGKLKSSGGVAYLSRLVSCIPTSCHAQHYAKIVKDWSNRRKAIGDAQRQAERAYEGKQRDVKVIEV